MGCTGSTTMIREERVEGTIAANNHKENTPAKKANAEPKAKATNNENKGDKALQANKNAGNVDSPHKMTNSATQDRLIQQVKSEVYDDLMKQAMFEVEKDASAFKL